MESIVQDFFRFNVIPDKKEKNTSNTAFKKFNEQHILNEGKRKQ